MDLDYDRKFEEMKKYIPFLESMIKRLESTNSSSTNPRQAQLDKIRSLRDLLLNKKKRMKMENLLKCEQVLVNLYAKVEQRDTLGVVKKAPDPQFSIDPPTPQEKSDLEAVRNKLKSVSKRQDDIKETLPEILRVNEVEDIHTAGSKEPALFQRRPNKSSLSPTHRSPTKVKEEKLSPQSAASKRNYTRVLVSPDTASRRWSTSETSEEKPLFSRRSPRRSPRRHSPSNHKKERKKSSKELTGRKSKDLNITLNVPEDSLNTLNTKDIFTRIINCKDTDVDIDTLRELRKQILTELKKTGARDDISDLILKSYNKKEKPKKTEEVEEGELSDSESEVIENVYGSLSGNLVFKDQNESKTLTDKDKARKIQICLVINSDKNNTDSDTIKKSDLHNTSDELEMYDNDSENVLNETNKKESNQTDEIKINDDNNKTPVELNIKNDQPKEDQVTVNEISKQDFNLQQPPEEKKQESVKYKANFYKPISESVETNKSEECDKVISAQVVSKTVSDKVDDKTNTSGLEAPNTSKDVCNIEIKLNKMETPIEIPLLNEPATNNTPSDSTLSQIDILQALRNEIESIAIPGNSEAGTPLLHQPKVNKVANAKDILPKKRISIENYKQKAVSSIKSYFDNDVKDEVKKPSLKLTEKECERFNIQKKISFDDDSSDGDDEHEIQVSDVYSDLAPKSPDRDDTTNSESMPPVIIPVDPVKIIPTNHKADVDMRTLPHLSPNNIKTPTLFNNTPALSVNDTIIDTNDKQKSSISTDQTKSQNKPTLFDPRVRRDVNSSQSPSPHTVTNPERTPRPAFISQSPAQNPALTPNARSYEMTPSHQLFDIDQSNKKHVYVPSFSTTDTRERENSVTKDYREKETSGERRERKSRFEDIGDTSWSSSDVSSNTRYIFDSKDPYYKRVECPKTPLPSFGRSDVPASSIQTFSRLDKPVTPLHPFGRTDTMLPFVRSECPPTPSHSFGRIECPPTPSHPFGRLDCPPTPSHSFGRLDCPSTPSHPFGRSDCSSASTNSFSSHSYNIIEPSVTPSHNYGAPDCPPASYYGRNECPPTPSHGFGRSDGSTTPSHSFGRSEVSTNKFGRSDFNTKKNTKDPRLNRKTEYESSSQLNEKDKLFYKDRGYYRERSYKSQKPFGGSDSYTIHDREHGRNSQLRYNSAEPTGRPLSKDQTRLEQSTSSVSNNYDIDRSSTRERAQYTSGFENVASKQRSHRERSLGRTTYAEDNHEKSVVRHVRNDDNYTHALLRTPIDKRSSFIESENNSLSVTPHAGRSFTIDTSVNSTFQNFLESGKIIEQNFDARRQRASSVGRSLIRESSRERAEKDKFGSEQVTETQRKKDIYRRASSVGRDLAYSTADKRTLQEIKADFKTYKHPTAELSKFDTGKIKNIDSKPKSTTENIGRSRKESYEKYRGNKFEQKTSKLVRSYSPRMNYRDPRMRKNYADDRNSEDLYARKSGIVYSNDNIVKGAILASGYGVRNYKIPKIKRPMEEKEPELPQNDQNVHKKEEKDKDIKNTTDKKKEAEELVTEKANDKSRDKLSLKQRNKDTPKDKSNDISTIREATKVSVKEVVKDSDTKSDSESESKQEGQTERRSTRLSRKMAMSKNIKAIKRNKKPKRSIISDSDSETDNSNTERSLTVDTNDLNITKPKPGSQVTSPNKMKAKCIPDPVNIQSNFGLDLEMFTDNAASDPVLDNISALIAGLDNDLDTFKEGSTNNFTNEITVENMMQNITCPKDNSSETREETSDVVKDDLPKTTEISLSDLTGKEINITDTKLAEENKNIVSSNAMNSNSSACFGNLIENTKSAEESKVIIKSEEAPSQNDQVKQKVTEPFSSTDPTLNKPTHEDIVSTTEIEKDTVQNDDKFKSDELSLDGCSTPDSTINTDSLEQPKNDDFVADSTNEEVHSETKVSSTESVEPKHNSSGTETVSDSELGNLLTMLQDKSKIKKLLSMLGGQSGENDKIKKKLEKLSEIVSDDDEVEERCDEKENKTKTPVCTDDVNSKTDQIPEKAVIETELQSIKNNEETTLSKDDENTQLSKDDENTQLSKDEENTRLSKKIEKKELSKDEEKSGLSKEIEKTELSKDEENTGLSKEIEKTELSKDEENTGLRKEIEKIKLQEDIVKTEFSKNSLEVDSTKDNKEIKLDIYSETLLNNDNKKAQLDKEENLENDQDKEESFEDIEDSIETQGTKNKHKKKVTGKKSKFAKKGNRGRPPKKLTAQSIAEKRVTRATAAGDTKPKPKKPPRELQQLHEDIKEMFMRDDVLSATGIRMCRLAKMVDEKHTVQEDVIPEAEPVVILEKFKNSDKNREPISEKVKKKPGPKSKPKVSADSLSEVEKPKYKPGPKSKTKAKRESDPYTFDTDSVGDTTTEKVSEDDSDHSSDTDGGSLASSKSYDSIEIITDVKKKSKRKRRGWQDGIIKPKHKKKKLETKTEHTLEPSPDSNVETEKQIAVPDNNCFTDRNYCFRKNEIFYSCRLCTYFGSDVVNHYKSEHPHVQIPLSRMTPAAAKEAIEQCKEIKFQTVSKISSDKYVCIFCYQEFHNIDSILETFFWHVVSMHTGEYMHSCSECPIESRCTFNLDIPPAPKDSKGQLIGFICKKCNFTQLSLENLKTHVIVHHNDEQTAVYKINLAAMSNKVLKEFLRRCDVPEPPMHVSDRSKERTVRLSGNSSAITESSETETARRTPSIQSKITFEADDNVGGLSDFPRGDSSELVIKVEQVKTENTDEILQNELPCNASSEVDRADVEDNYSVQSARQEDEQPDPISEPQELPSQPSNDIVDYPHFKINITESSAKEYICCINGKDNHFKTTLLISMKKHVQLKHSECWDGYCYVCKVIVTPQGTHKFKDCLQHYLDKHMDNFPVYQQQEPTEPMSQEITDKQVESPASSKSYIKVRPPNELLSNVISTDPNESSGFPVIQSVVSLGAGETPLLNPTYPTMRQEAKSTSDFYKYEEVQASVMLNKHRVVLENMMAEDKLIKVYKCAGRFCSFTTDSAEEALLHASTHQRIGGVDALKCSYCDFNSLANAIDLVMHVFKTHASCQYSCGQCFYRAAASQSVAVHATRVHGSQAAITVLRTTVATNAPVDGKMLTRDEAVPFYVCAQVDSNGPSSKCKFRTYIPDKFCEHLHLRHAGATVFPCYICRKELSSTLGLVQHMKTHAMRLYQCSWCVFGADNELDLLGHMSIMHPDKQPQAYLRIITNKEGSKDMRVLPLIVLNKMKVATKDVKPSTSTENPVREAERSIDLEKLISLTVMVESENDMSEPLTVNTALTEDITKPSVQSAAPGAPAPTPSPILSALLSPVSAAVATISAPNQAEVTPNQPSPHTPAVSLIVDSEPSIKSEVTDKSNSATSAVLVLDSDEEDTSQSVIDLSDEDQTNKIKIIEKTSRKIAPSFIATCPKCRQVCKSMTGLKKHLNYCYPNKEEGCKCAHCPYLASSRDNIIQHYMDDHCDRNVYLCGICRTTQLSVNLLKRHLKYIHKEKDYLLTSTVENGITCYTINPTKKDKKEMPKRKLSGNASETLLPKRRFSPQEINLLPINPILEHLVYCEICEFSTKVRLNMVRHLQLHAEQQPVAQTAPVNPVPHLETNEKHFDKMVNLASSSLTTRPERPERPDRPAERPVIIGVPVPREQAARYPRQISARQRNTCGAVGCTYTSVDEAMLKRHWDALHSGPSSFSFRCVHCPNTQTTDTSKPITAGRVLQHLKMHDDTLYACSKCSIYHFKREFLEKHIIENHPTASLYIVRESASAAAAAAIVTPPSAAPTMDLKPWQCGFCQFKSMLRPEVAEHCFKLHQSKMQFRCGYCPYRASVLENVNNHLAHSHADEPEDVIYYYYREGSLPDDQDGTPRWVRQQQRLGAGAALPEVKEEPESAEPDAPAVPAAPAAPAAPAVPTAPTAPTVAAPSAQQALPVTVDLNLVKKEVDEVLPETETIEDLCKKFGEFCEPNGIKFKCPLCKIVMEDTRQDMQSHLFEELQYRKWGCGLCNYKAFHKAGLTEHMSMEHNRQYDHIELPIDASKEKWVAGQLDHQAAIIDRHKANLAKQKIAVEKVKPAPAVAAPPAPDVVEKFSIQQLEEAFGPLGEPGAGAYCCPKCRALYKDEPAMRDHMEMELNKIRWGCTNCSDKYQTYHEAQFHCKGHDGPSRPKEAIRDPALRAAWVAHVIQAQKRLLQAVPVASSTTSNPPTPEKSISEHDNSLLVVRYEERVPTPDMLSCSRKRPAPESDDERLVIDEGIPKKKSYRQCPYCTHKSKYYNSWKEHVLKHFNMKPYSCYYCEYGCTYKQGILTHTEKQHPTLPLQAKTNSIPQDTNSHNLPKNKLTADEDSNVPKVVCLFCEKSMSETETEFHLHDKIKPDFAKKGDVVVKCCICLVLRLDVPSLHEHHSVAHPHVPINYALFKLHHDSRETHLCGYCPDSGFKFLRDLKTHHNAIHPLFLFKYTTIPYALADFERRERRAELPLAGTSGAAGTAGGQKKCARKSTTKLPGGKSVARKSTTRLPYDVPDSEDGYCYYKTKPHSLDDYANVTTLMSFCNRMMPFTLKKLSEIINLEPKVIVRDIRAGNSSDVATRE